MSVGVMEDYKLRDLRASHTVGWSWNWNTYGLQYCWEVSRFNINFYTFQH
jgi:hypothetical protein